ncbi:hypothetical protein ACOMHN_036382 [Nucella lapillus]
MPKLYNLSDATTTTTTTTHATCHNKTARHIDQLHHPITRILMPPIQITDLAGFPWRTHRHTRCWSAYPDASHTDNRPCWLPLEDPQTHTVLFSAHKETRVH